MMHQTRFVGLRVKWTTSIFFSLITVWLFLSGPAAAQSLNQANGHYYQLFKRPWLLWQQARDSAISLGGHLATITSPQENYFVNGLLTPSCQIAFIGGTDKTSQGQWQWVTSEEFVYSNWAYGEYRGAGKYLAIWRDLGWKELRGVAAPYVVEWDSVVPSTYTPFVPNRIAPRDLAGTYECVRHTEFTDRRIVVGTMQVEPLYSVQPMGWQEDEDSPVDFRDVLAVRFSVVCEFSNDKELKVPGRQTMDVFKRFDWSYRFIGTVVGNRFEGHWLSDHTTTNVQGYGSMTFDNKPEHDMEACVQSASSIEVREGGICYEFHQL